MVAGIKRAYRESPYRHRRATVSDFEISEPSSALKMAMVLGVYDAIEAFVSVLREAIHV